MSWLKRRILIEMSMQLPVVDARPPVTIPSTKTASSRRNPQERHQILHGQVPHHLLWSVHQSLNESRLLQHRVAAHLASKSVPAARPSLAQKQKETAPSCREQVEHISASNSTSWACLGGSSQRHMFLGGIPCQCLPMRPLTESPREQRDVDSPRITITHYTQELFRNCSLNL